MLFNDVWGVNVNKSLGRGNGLLAFAYCQKMLSMVK